MGTSVRSPIAWGKPGPAKSGSSLPCRAAGRCSGAPSPLPGELPQVRVGCPWPNERGNLGGGAILPSVPFALYEYEAAFGEFFGDTLRTLARARSPILSRIKFVDVSGTVGFRIRDRDGVDIELLPGETSTDVTTDLQAVRDGDYEKLYAELNEGADSMAEQLVRHLVDTLTVVTEGTGNVVAAGGQQFSFDVYYEMLEKMEFSVNENDELVMPAMLMHPKQLEKLRELPPWTPEQPAKLEELKQRKREEALARRHSRRLS